MDDLSTIAQNHENFHGIWPRCLETPDEASAFALVLPYGNDFSHTHTTFPPAALKASSHAWY
jgi:hypothetical protein